MRFSRLLNIRRYFYVQVPSSNLITVAMKKLLACAVFAFATFFATPCSFADQDNSGTQGLKYDAVTRMLFGDNQCFVADMEVITTGKEGEISMNSRMSVDDGKCRFEFNVADIKGTQVPPGAAEQMRSMGMDRTIVISRDNGRDITLVYPGLSGYVSIPAPHGAQAEGALEAVKMNAHEVGTETLDGHKCVKNAITITDNRGAKHESTVWNAKDMKNFPLMIKMNEGGMAVTMRFRNVTFDTPPEVLFNPPAGCTKYPSVPAMMQQALMKRFSQMNAEEAGEE
jgi:hypothetical protein